MMVDKILVKDYVARVIGPEHIIPTLGTWDDPDEIDFSALPDQFVLKCNHNSGLGMCICKNKEELNISKLKKELKKGLKQNYYLLGREWPYKNVEHGIIAEKYMTDGSGTELKDYKFYCFNGEPKFLYIGYANMRDGTKHDLLSFFDLNLDPTPFYRTDHEPLPFAVERPEKLDKMIEIARKLSNGIPFLRVDLYYIQEQIYFSELTFYPGSGYGPFSPPEWERKIGDMLILPQVRKRA